MMCRGTKKPRFATSSRKSTQIDFIETPLSDAIAYLSDFHSLQIVIDAKELEEAGVATNAPVTCRLKDISLGARAQHSVAAARPDVSGSRRSADDHDRRRRGRDRTARISAHVEVGALTKGEQHGTSEFAAMLEKLWMPVGEARRGERWHGRYGRRHGWQWAEVWGVACSACRGSCGDQAPQVTQTGQAAARRQHAAAAQRNARRLAGQLAEPKGKPTIQVVPYRNLILVSASKSDHETLSKLLTEMQRG